MHQRLDEIASTCSPKFMGCFDIQPPLSTKLIVNTRCVAKVGTHFATELRSDAAARGCENMYAPLGSKETRVARGLRVTPPPGAQEAISLSGALLSGDASLSGALWSSSSSSAAPVSVRAKDMHRACAATLHLNHYAVKSREDYLQKFQRGRISRGDRDVKEGLAVRNATTGVATLRSLPPNAIAKFLGDKPAGLDTRHGTLSAIDQRLLDIALQEFEVPYSQLVNSYNLFSTLGPSKKVPCFP